MHMAGLGAGAIALPSIPAMGKSIPVEELLNPGLAVAAKKEMRKRKKPRKK